MTEFYPYGAPKLATFKIKLNVICLFAKHKTMKLLFSIFFEIDEQHFANMVLNILVGLVLHSH